MDLVRTKKKSVKALAPHERVSCTGGGVCYTPRRSLRFFLIGDTGGLPLTHTTFGQTTVAASMNDISAVDPVDFVVNDSFENVYTDHLEVPWYMIAGNHDHFGNIDAQLEYTYYSRKWTFPDLYYKAAHRFGPQNTSVDFVFIDTIVLCGNTQDIQNGGFLDVVFTKAVDPNRPSNPVAADRQWNWIVDQLNSSTADYLFVVGHYPIYSVSSHGPTRCLLRHLNPILKQYGASAYFAGHDHTLQHIRELDKYGQVAMEHIISGGGSRLDRSLTHEDSVPERWLKFHYPSDINPFSQLGISRGAFMLVDITTKRANFEFYRGDGQLRYETNISPRKRRMP